MTKRGIVLTGLGVVALAAAGATARWWLPPVWRMATDNQRGLGVATDIATWVLWALGAIVALVKWPRRPRRGSETPVPITQQIHQQIIQQAATAPASALHQLPRPPDDFTGRQEELEELRGAVAQGGATISGLAGVAGMGGVGKTALALKLADELKACYPHAQFYLDLRGTTEPLTPAQAMAHVIHGFHPELRLPESEAELAGLYRSLLEGKQALLLMDNAGDAAQVEPLIPPAGCLLLVTSRQHFTLPGLYAKNLDVLPPEDARGLLLAIEPRIGQHADEIARLCGCLPIALRAAASALKERPDLAPADYARRLSDEQARLAHLGAVEVSLGLSYELLDAEMQERWRASAVFPGSFDAEGAAAVWQVESDAARNTLTALVARSMVEWEEATNRYRLHDLLRLLADSRLTETERAKAQRAHGGYYVGVLAAADHRYLEGSEGIMRGLALFDAERGNMEAGQGWAASLAEKDDQAAKLCSRYPDAGSYVLHLRQHPRECISWLESALAAAQHLKDRTAEGVHLGNLGLSYAALGETRRAIEYHEQALAIAREIGDRRGEGNALGNLGNAYADLGETRRAIEHHELALAIDREIGNRRGEGEDLGNLGSAYFGLGETRRAIQLHEQALAIDREIGDRRGEGQALGNLANAYLTLGETRRAMELYEQDLAIAREIGDRRGEGSTLGNLGNAFFTLGETRRAIEYHEQHLAIAREIGDRRGEGQALGNLGNAYAALGETRRAIEHYEQDLTIMREIGDRRGEGNALGNLGNAYLTLGDTRRAIEFYEQQLTITREIGDRRGEGNALWNMSVVLMRLGQRAEAIARAEPALAIYEQIEDPNAAKVRERLEEWRRGG